MPSLWNSIAPGQFRLLRRNEEGDGYILTTHVIAFAPLYRALSYACGNGPKSVKIRCADRNRGVFEVIEISQTLNGALAQLSSVEKPLWVDAICINQRDPVEKAQQVAMMHQIYRRADEVAIWLDHGTHVNFIMRGSKCLAMDVLKWISMPPPTGRIDAQLAQFPALKQRLQGGDGRERLTRRQLAELSSVISRRQRVRLSEDEFEMMNLPAFDDPIWRALGEVMSMPWLFRLWTFQEVMLGRSSFIACEDRTLAWRTYFDIGVNLSRSGLMKHCLLSLHNQAHQPQALTFFDRLEPFLDARQMNVPFSICLREARQRDVTETVDRIFAIHSLANETLRTQIKVDYSPRKMLNFWEVFIGVGRAVIETEGAQAILAQANSPQKPGQLPSWCPDFRVPCPSQPFSPEARAGLKYPRQSQTHHDPRVINVVGAQLLRINSVSSWFAWAWPDQDVQEIYGANGVAGKTLQWLESCKRLAQKSCSLDEEWAHRAYLLTLFAGVLEDEPPLMAQVSSRLFPLENLSSLARDFIYATPYDLSRYSTFISDHPTVLNEDPESFIAAARSAHRFERPQLAKACIEKAVFLHMCPKQGAGQNVPEAILRYIDDLSNHSQRQKDFENMFTDLWRQVLLGEDSEQDLSSEATNGDNSEGQFSHPIEKDPNSPQALRNQEWLGQKNEALTKFISQLEALQRDERPDDTMHGSRRWQELQPILTELGDIWRNRVFFTTDPVGEESSIGFASNNILPHDHVCVLFGEPQLYILRDRPRGLYEFISDAYVEGFVTGKGCEKLKGQVFAIS